MSAGSAASATGWPGAPVPGHHKLHRSYGRDQTYDCEFGKAVGILDLRILDPQAVRFHRTKHLFDDPPHAIPGDDLAGLL
jgi:hypothetical protein